VRSPFADPFVPTVASHDLAIVIASHGDARWLDPCLASLDAHAGPLVSDVVVIENGGADEAALAALSARHPRVRLLRCENRGFGHANNVGAATCDARHLLFLNPDTEIVAGTLEQLLAALERRPRVGLAGVRQVAGDGTPLPTLRREPTVARAVGEALFIDRWPLRPAWLSECEDDDGEERLCGWTAGSFLLVRSEAFAAAGGFDERFFLFSEEPDLCRRVRAAGWEVCHMPQLTLRHHGGRLALDPWIREQHARARLLFAAVHFPTPRREAYRLALLLHHALRYLTAFGDPRRRALRQSCAVAALRALARPALR
jgi:N-acetylglucosaminyl-diphospho-decaprenol L-rhamnosyltransferase